MRKILRSFQGNYKILGKLRVKFVKICTNFRQFQARFHIKLLGNLKKNLRKSKGNPKFLDISSDLRLLTKFLGKKKKKKKKKKSW